jgi:hypothetical protein
MNNRELVFIYPCDFFNEKSVDEMYQHEYNVVKKSGFKTELINTDLCSAKNLTKYPHMVSAIYRGWMLIADQYQAIYHYLFRHNIELRTFPEMYIKSHHLPNWYRAISKFTPETVICQTLKAAKEQIKVLNWPQYFIKDYVKSLKTSRGSVIGNITELEPLLTEMQHYRGAIEGGICIRRFIPLDPTSEKRYFVINGTAYEPSGNISSHPLLTKIVQAHDAYFYSVDIVNDIDGKEWVIEIGDGQVSDLVGWKAEDFVKIWLLSDNLA